MKLSTDVNCKILGYRGIAEKGCERSIRHKENRLDNNA